LPYGTDAAGNFHLNLYWHFLWELSFAYVSHALLENYIYTSYCTSSPVSCMGTSWWV